MKKNRKSVSSSHLSIAIAQRQCSPGRLLLDWNTLPVSLDLSLFSTANNHRFLHIDHPHTSGQQPVNPFPTQWLCPLSESFPLPPSMANDVLYSGLLILTHNETLLLQQRNNIPSHQTGHSCIEYGYSDRAAILNHSASFAYRGLVCTTHYRLNLRKGWNRIYRTLTYKSTHEQVIEYSHQAPCPQNHFAWQTDRY